MNDFMYNSANFNPSERSKHLCVNFNNVVKTFATREHDRVAGLLSADIYDVPCFESDKVAGGALYADFITTAPYYYLYRAEPPLLETFASVIGEKVGTGATIYDLGPGPKDSIACKTMTVLPHVVPYHVYRPIDVAPQFIQTAENAALQDYPDLPVKGLVMNFQQTELPEAENDKSLILYLGSTISNAPSKPQWTFMDNPYYQEYLGLLRRPAAQKGYLLLTHDCNQDEQSLLASYSHETTAAFFVNVMHKIKRDLSSEDLDADAFEYACTWNNRAHCIEHSVVPTRNQTFTIHDPFNRRSAKITVHEGQRYIIVNSYKPSVGQMQQRLLQAGWKPLLHQVDDETGYLAAHLCIAR